MPVSAGVTVRKLLDRAIDLAEWDPELAPMQKDSLPDYSQWHASQETVEHLVAAIKDIQADGVLANHPLAMLSPKVARHERPRQLIDSSLRTAQQLLQSLTAALRSSGISEDHWRTLSETFVLLEYAASLEYLARNKLMGLLDEQSQSAKTFAAGCKQQASARAALAQAQQATKHWTNKLPADEVQIALDQAKGLEGKLLSMLNPAWWRLRKALKSRYNFAAHAVKPRWSQVLLGLDSEYKTAAALAQAEQSVCEELGVTAPLETVIQQVLRARKWAQQMPPSLQPLHRSLAQSGRAAQSIARLLEAQVLAQQLHQACEAFLEGFAARSLKELEADLKTLERSQEMLTDFLYCLGQLAQLPDQLAAAFRTLPLDARRLEAAIVSRCVDETFRSDRTLNRFNGAVRDGHVDRLAKLSRKWQEVNAAAVLEKSRQSFLEHIRIASLQAAQLTGEQKEFKAVYNRGRREIEHEFGKVMRHKSIRDIVGGDSALVVSDLKPVWLMSPLSVSDTLPLQTDQFDVVIFDEASQITLEEAVPSIFRATQAIVVGDEMQLPPTDFFSAKTDGEDEEGLLLSENGQTFEYDLSSNSFLNHAAKNLPARMLGWHYRSRSESLISFSNWAFYQGKLLTVPEESLAAVGSGEIIVQAAKDGAANVAKLLDRPVSFHFIANGIYDARRNRNEAQYIAHMVRGMLTSENHRSIGIVAFSEAQQTEIESALTRLAEEDKQFADRLEEEYEREVDGQYVGLLIKNLENIQGDERDIVIMSICYGNAPDNKMRMNFGPINQNGGEKRLNVAFSRAKHHMAVVSSIRHAAITNDYNDGANCLKAYLHYAEACSSGNADTSQRVLRELAVWRDVEQPDEQSQNICVAHIAAALTKKGYAVSTGVGMSHFRCDLAVRRHGELRYRLGILVDTDAHYEQDDLLERELMRPQLLRTFGWNIAHVLARDWYHDSAGVLERLVRVIEHGEDAREPETEGEEDSEDAWAEFDGPEEPEPAVEDPQDTATSAPSDGQGPDGNGQAPAKPARPATGPVDFAPGPFTRHFEFVGGNSSKFWEISLAGSSISVRFGRIGTTGQEQTKVFADDATAARTAHRLIREKLAKGYLAKSPPQR